MKLYIFLNEQIGCRPIPTIKETTSYSWNQAGGMHLYRKTKEESGKRLNNERRKDIKLTFVGSATPSGPILSGDKGRSPRVGLSCI